MIEELEEILAYHLVAAEVLIAHSANLMCSILLCHFNGKRVHFLICNLAGKGYENEIVERLLAI